jgi:ankyrin repeat protein
LGANLNIQNAQGQTALHVAVVQGNVEIIEALRAGGADLSVADTSGNVAMAYARDRLDVRKALVDPVLDILVKLARGGFSKADEAAACALLAQNTGVVGCLATRDVVDVVDHDGSTPLIQAVVHGKHALVRVLVPLGADPHRVNHAGMSSVAWAVWNRNRRIQTLLTSADVGNDEKEAVPVGVERLREAVRNHPTCSTLLFMGACPPGDCGVTHSGIVTRMDEFINAPMLDARAYAADDDDVGDVGDEGKMGKSNVPLMLTLSASLCGDGGDTAKSKSKFKSDPSSGGDDGIASALGVAIWNAKICAIGQIASGSLLPPPCLASLALWTNNTHVASEFNTRLLVDGGCGAGAKTKQQQAFVDTFAYALASVRAYTGEVYIGSSSAQRKMYTVGQTFSWNHFASASSMWKVALEAAPLFTSKSRKGIVFIVHSTTGRHIAPHSMFSNDGEVVFLPGTRFKVVAWYHGGNAIALGQANIREHTFGVKERDDERMDMGRLMESDKSLIVELREVQAKF